MTTKSSHRTPARGGRPKTHAPAPAHPAQAHPRSVPIEALETEYGSDPDQPFAEGAQDAMDPEFRHRLISANAYNLYEQRGFADGYDLDDWLQAEADVDHLLLNRPARGR
jgi:hypothetical protein